MLLILIGRGFSQMKNESKTVMVRTTTLFADVLFLWFLYNIQKSCSFAKESVHRISHGDGKNILLRVV